ALGRPGRVAAFDRLRVLPAERREGDDPGVEPGVAHLGDPPHLVATDFATDCYLVDPGAVELLELVEPPGRPLLELRARADHIHLAALTRIDRKRQPEVALA